MKSPPGQLGDILADDYARYELALLQATACGLWAPSHCLIQRWFIVDNVPSHSTGGNFRENAQDNNRWNISESNAFKIVNTLSGANALRAWLLQAVSTLLASYGTRHRHDPGAEKNKRQCNVIRGTSYITTRDRFRVFCPSNISMNRLCRLHNS